MRKTILKLSVFALAITLMACSKDSATFDEKLKVSFEEELIEDERKLFMLLETERNYDCLNYVVDYSLNGFRNRQRINLKGVKTTENCQSGQAPAKAKIKLRNISLGRDVVELDFGQVSFFCHIQANDSTYAFAFPENRLISFSQDTLIRIGYN